MKLPRRSAMLGGAALAAIGATAPARAQLTNQKAMHDREAHQMDIIGKQADMQLAAQKMDMARASAIAKQNDMAARANERQAAMQMKAMQPPEGQPL